MTWGKELDVIAAMKKAPSGQFRVLMVDTGTNPPLGEPSVLCDCDTLEAAQNMANAHGSFMLPCHVYDATGRWLHSAGRS